VTKLIQLHGVGSNQFLSVNISVIRLLSVITTTPFGNYGTSETMFDQKKMEKDQELIFSHICSNNKGTLQIFHDIKENCRITIWNSVTKLIQVFYCSVKDSEKRFMIG
jgi:hypothetical protein